MKANLRFFLFIAVIAFALLAVGARPAAAVQQCEVDVEEDGGDADDVCVVTSSSVDPDCTLKKVIEHAYQDKWCAIDHNQKYGAFVFIQGPVEGTPSPSNRNTEPGETTLKRTIGLPGKLPNDGSGQYGKGSGDPLVIVGYLLQYTTECLAKGCMNPSSNDWEDHALDDTFWKPQHTNHDMFDATQWGVEDDNGDDWDPVIERPPENDDGDFVKAVINVDLDDANKVGFKAKASSYVQFRYVTLALKNGAAFEFKDQSSVSFLYSRIEVDAGNEADHIFEGVGQMPTDGVMGGTTPLVISISKAVTPASPFAIVETGGADQGRQAVEDFHNAIAFETTSLPEGISFATWPDADPVSCRATGEVTGTEYGCRFNEEDLGAIQEKVVFLEEFEGSDDFEGATLYTVGKPQEVRDGEITVALGEAVFAADGRRIEVDIPACPDGSTPTPSSNTPSSLSCPSIENGTINGLGGDGTWQVICNNGYRLDGAAACVLNCSEHSSPNEDETECLVDEGYEWNINHAQIFAECPGEAVPDADGNECVCANGDLEIWQDAGGEYHCKRPCPDDPLMFRDERGNCACPEGYRKRSQRCVVIEEDRSGDRTAGATRTTRDAGTAAADTDPQDDTTCVGLFCSGSSLPVDPAGGGAYAAEPKAFVSGGCSLAPSDKAPVDGWFSLLLLAPILIRGRSSIRSLLILR